MSEGREVEFLKHISRGNDYSVLKLDMAGEGKGSSPEGIVGVVVSTSHAQYVPGM